MARLVLSYKKEIGLAFKVANTYFSAGKQRMPYFTL